METAIKLCIKDVLSLPYRQEEDWRANHLEMPDGRKASRISIIGVLVSSDESSAVIDDGTDTAILRLFEQKKLPAVGSVVNVIARVRETNNERFLSPEIIKQVAPKWLEVRRKEIPTLTLETVETTPVIEDQPYERIITAIHQLDSGGGANTDEVLALAKTTEKTLESLLKEGEIYEIRPGKLKVLE